MDQTEQLCYHAVAFLDVLGQRAHLRKLKRLPQDGQQRDETILALRQTVGFVRSLREQFRGFFEEVSKSHIDRESLSPENQQAFQKSRRLEPLMRGFSDSIIITVALNVREEATPVNGVLATLYGAAGIMIGSLAAGHAMRGGVDVGLGIEVECGEVYGPAIERAYQLESAFADYPRILVGSELLRYLSDVAQNSDAATHHRMARVMAETCQRFITTDTDGLPMLDFLGEGVRSVGDVPVHSELVSEAYAFVVAQQGSFAASGDLRLASRYGQLRHYFESRLPLWGRNA